MKKINFLTKNIQIIIIFIENIDYIIIINTIIELLQHLTLSENHKIIFQEFNIIHDIFFSILYNFLL